MYCELCLTWHDITEQVVLCFDCFDGHWTDTNIEQRLRLRLMSIGQRLQCFVSPEKMGSLVYAKRHICPPHVTNTPTMVVSCLFFLMDGGFFYGLNNRDFCTLWERFKDHWSFHRSLICFLDLAEHGENSQSNITISIL